MSQHWDRPSYSDVSIPVSLSNAVDHGIVHEILWRARSEHTLVGVQDAYNSVLREQCVRVLSTSIRRVLADTLPVESAPRRTRTTTTSSSACSISPVRGVSARLRGARRRARCGDQSRSKI
jgi:hypothetical protein